MRRQANSLSGALSWALPWKTALMDAPKSSDMWRNILGVAAVAGPSVALASWIANEVKMKKVREAIDKNAQANLDARLAVLSPNKKLGDVAEERAKDGAELSSVNSSLKKSASVGWLDRTVRGALPMAALPLTAWLAATAVNKVLEDKYGAELDAENGALEDMQRHLDMQELERLGYIKKKPQEVKPDSRNNTPANKLIKKEASVGGDIIRQGWNGLTTIWGTGRKALIDVPSQLLLLATLGLSGYGIHHFLKESDEVKKLKLVEKKMLGKDKLLDSPKLMVDIPEGYEETGKRTAQLLPGISPALIPQQAVEDAIVVEKPKKDVFLG